MRNAALRDLARVTIAGFRDALAAAGIAAPLFITQNDGTVMAADTAMALPVMSFASGATNSMRGAAFLSGIKDALVVDVGGTSSDVGQLRNGFPREANSVVEVGGVRTVTCRTSIDGPAAAASRDRGAEQRARTAGYRPLT